MSHKIRRIIRPFHFDSRRTTRLQFSDPSKIRFNDDDKINPFISLKNQGGGKFPIDLDLTATTEMISPQALIEWIAFEGVGKEPPQTSVKYRLILGAGSEEFFWNNTQWDLANLNEDWSTSEEVNANIKALPIQSGKKIAIKLNLRSLDGRATPRVHSVKLLGRFDVDWTDDLIFTVLSRLHQTFRSRTYMRFVVDSKTSSIDLCDSHAPDNQDYNFTDVIGVFNLTTDPQKSLNLAVSYALGPPVNGEPSSGVVTLSKEVSAGDQIEIIMEIVPEFARSTSQDFYEQAKFPAIVLERPIEVKGRGRARKERSLGHRGEFIRDLTRNIAVQTLPPKQAIIRFDFRILANSDRDLFNLIDAMSIWMTENKLLRTKGLDTEVVLDPGDEVNILKKVDLDDLREAIGNFQIQGVPFFLEESIDHNLIENINLNIMIKDSSCTNL